MSKNQLERLTLSDIPFILKILYGSVRQHTERYNFASKYAVGKKVLDAACGTGYGTEIISRKAQEVIGVDIDEEAINLARIKYTGQNIKFFRSDVCELPVKNNMLDLVVSFETIEHLNTNQAGSFIHEIYRVLKDDGLLIISTPEINNLSLGQRTSNQFHYKEYDYQNFIELFENYFLPVDSYGQAFANVFLLKVFKFLAKSRFNFFFQRVWRVLQIIFYPSGKVEKYSDHIGKQPMYMVLVFKKIRCG